MSRSINRRQIRRPPCVEELRTLLKMQDGVFSAETRPFPELHASPAIVARMAQSGERFQDALVRVLKIAIAELQYPEHYKEAILLQFGLDRSSRVSNWRGRLEAAYKKAGLKEGPYWTDELDDDGVGFEKTSVSMMMLCAIVEQLDKPELLETTSADSGDQRRHKPHPAADDALAAERTGTTGRSIRVGQLLIPDAISIASCDKLQSSTRELLLEFEGDLRPSRPDSEEWPLLNAQLLPVLEEEARQAAVKFENDPILDLVYVEHQPETAAGAQRYRIGVAESRYYHWTATANSLDRNLSSLPDLTERLDHPNLREAWRCDPSSLADLTRLPAPAFIGICVVVIAEGKIILLERRRDHHVANTAKGIPVHFMGEGMLPKDFDPGRYSPEQAARRGCYEELGIGHTHLTLIPTGLIIDTKRWQPLFCFVGECDLTIPQLTHCMENAPHRYETGYGEIAARLPWTARADQTLAVLTGEDPTFSLASNHAQAALLNALYYADGRQAVNKRLGMSGKY